MPTYSPRQIALALGVSQSSLKRWCDQGLLPAQKTAGKHRRISRQAVLEFVRSSGQPLANPHWLELPSSAIPSREKSPAKPRAAAESLQSQVLEPLAFKSLPLASQQFQADLEAGRELACRQLIVDLHLAGCPIADLGDHVIAPAFHSIGQRWSCGDVEVYQERRAVEICSRALHELATMLPLAADDAPLAIGATVEEDSYSLPALLIDLQLRQNGWRSMMLGTQLPLESFAKAVEKYRPRLVWLSATHLADEARFLRQLKPLFQSLPEHAPLAMGGQALSPDIRQRLPNAAFCDNLSHLKWLAQQTWKIAKPAAKRRRLAANQARRIPAP